MEFREVKSENDIKNLCLLIQEIWSEVFIPIIGKEQVDYMLVHYQGEAVITEDIKNAYRYFFIMDKEEAIGYFAYSMEEECLVISKIYLLKNFRGLGISRGVFDHIEETARKNNKKKLSLHVNRNNKRAVEVYLHEGFTIKEKVDLPLGDKFFLNDYVMEKELSPAI